MLELNVPGKELAAAAAFVTQVVPARPVEPELGGMLIDSNVHGGMRIAAYDYSVAAVSLITAETVSDGKVLVSARLMSAIASAVSGENEVYIRERSDGVHVIAGGDEWRLPKLEPLLYPELPKMPDSIGTIDAPEFAKALAKVLPCAGEPGAAPMLGGVCLSATEGDGMLTIATTDRWRLGVAQIELDMPRQQILGDTLIPADVLAMAEIAARRQVELHSEPGSDKPRVMLHLDQNGIALAGLNFAVIGRRLESKNPGVWRKLSSFFTAEPALDVLVDTAELRRAMTRAGLVLADEEPVAISFDFAGGADEGTMTIEPALATKAKATITLTTSWPHGDPCMIGLRGAYLRQAVSLLGSPAVLLSLANTRNAPLLLTPCDTDGTPLEGYTHLIAQQRAGIAA